MKILIATLTLFLSLHLAEAKKDFSGIAETHQSERERILSLSKKIMEGQKSKNYYQLTEEEASPLFLSMFTIQLQEMAYEKQIKLMFGDYISQKYYSHARAMYNNTEYTVYTLEATFSKAKKVEVVVSIDKDGKIGGYRLNPWSK
ncbi:MAG: hypothetical protein AB8B61_05105 [Cyclobacteriaceae bacterium]